MNVFDYISAHPWWTAIYIVLITLLIDAVFEGIVNVIKEIKRPKQELEKWE